MYIAGGVGGALRPLLNVWRMRLQLENQSLHLELVYSMGALF